MRVELVVAAAVEHLAVEPPEAAPLRLVELLSRALAVREMRGRVRRRLMLVAVKRIGADLRV